MKKLLLIVFLVNLSCAKDEEPIHVLPPLTETISYEALGSGKLVFERDGKVYIIDVDNQTTWGLELTSKIASIQRQAISPDGKKIIYDINTSHNQREVYIVSINGTNIKNISTSPWSCYALGWTHNSGEVLYNEYAPEDNRFLYRQSVLEDEKSVVRTFRHLDFFKSGISTSQFDKLVFSFDTYHEDTGEVYGGIFTMDLDGSNLEQLTFYTTGLYPLSPVWSPNGERIAYIKFNLGQNLSYESYELFIMNKDGSDSTSIGIFEADDSAGYLGIAPSLCWSPDGSKIAFNKIDPDGTHIYTINIDGTNLTKITSAEGWSDSSLSWSSE